MQSAIPSQESGTSLGFGSGGFDVPFFKAIIMSTLFNLSITIGFLSGQLKTGDILSGIKYAILYIGLTASILGIGELYISGFLPI